LSRNRRSSSSDMRHPSGPPAQRSKATSSRSRIPTRATAYSPVSLLTISTRAAALTEWTISSPTFMRGVPGEVGETSRVDRSSSLKRDIGQAPPFSRPRPARVPRNAVLHGIERALLDVERAVQDDPVLAGLWIDRLDLHAGGRRADEHLAELRLERRRRGRRGLERGKILDAEARHSVVSFLVWRSGVTGANEQPTVRR